MWPPKDHDGICFDPLLYNKHHIIEYVPFSSHTFTLHNFTALPFPLNLYTRQCTYSFLSFSFTFGRASQHFCALVLSAGFLVALFLQVGTTMRSLKFVLNILDIKPGIVHTMDHNTKADKQIIQVHCNCNMERPILFYMCKSSDSGKAYMQMWLNMVLYLFDGKVLYKAMTDDRLTKSTA